MKKLLREPLVHFLLLGAGLFVAFGLVGKRSGSEPEEIVATQGQIESLAIGFARTWQRPPTESELEGLIQDYIMLTMVQPRAFANRLPFDQNNRPRYR